MIRLLIKEVLVIVFIWLGWSFLVGGLFFACIEWEILNYNGRFIILGIILIMIGKLIYYTLDDIEQL